MAEELIALAPGIRVGRWTITKKLGAGAFGAVYLCQNDENVRAALKAEPVNTPHPLLVMEAHVMKKLNDLRDGDEKHFCRCLDLGRDEKMDQQAGRMKQFNYIVMSLVGRGLDGAVKDVGGRLSLGSAVGMAIQMLRGLRGMHTIGYLHRDIKPGNACLGRAESNEERLLYMIDFGMARKYIKDDLHRPREASNFRGSPRYAAISAHIGREYSHKDDIESWFYVLIELYKGALPWQSTGDMKLIGEAKTRRQKKQPEHVRRQAIGELLAGCPKEFGQLLKNIDDMKFTDKPDYEWIITTLRTCLANAGVQEVPYDWEAGGRNTGQAPSGGGGGGGGGADSYFN